jgi:DNA-binding response OmpR family regulator
MPEASRAPFDFVPMERTRALVVDDDPILREFACVYLAGPATTVDIASDAAAGLALLALQTFDVALIDIDMPGMNGIDMVRALRSDPRTADLPVIMVTGLDDIVSIDAAYDAGATSFVTKPVNWRLLTYHMRFVLRSQRKAFRAARFDDRGESRVTRIHQAVKV